MILFLSIIILLLGFSIFLGDISVLVIPLFFLSLGNLSIMVMANKSNKFIYHKIFNVTSLIYYVYAIACFWYMTSNGYNYLLVSDTITAYIPYTEDFMNLNTFGEMWNEIYDNTISKYNHVGIITIYFAYVGKIASLLGGENLYFNLQASIIFFSGLFSVFLYKFLVTYDIPNSFKYTLIYSFGSVFFYYSTFILREAPIAFLYIVTFCYILQKLSIRNSVIILTCIIFTWMLRPQMGMFLCAFAIIPFLKDRNGIMLNFLSFIAIVAIAFLFYQLDVIEMLKYSQEHTRDLMLTKDADSTLNAFNSLPLGIAQIVKVIYIQLSPIPCWSYIDVGANASEVNNIMGFPRAYAVLYNYIIWGLLVLALVNWRRMFLEKKDWMLLSLVFLFLILQTNSTEQRRMLICFPILYIYALLTSKHLGNIKVRTYVEYSILLFVVAQILGFIKFL